jgi:hypothetical protein
MEQERENENKNKREGEKRKATDRRNNHRNMLISKFAAFGQIIRKRSINGL